MSEARRAALSLLAVQLDLPLIEDDKGVAYVPGSPFYAGPPDRRTVRLSFVTANVEQIDPGIAALAAAIPEGMGGGRC